MNKKERQLLQRNAKLKNFIKEKWTTRTVATCTNFLLTESAVITGKYQTEVLTVRTERVGRGPYIKDQGLIFSRNDQAGEVNKRFIIWPF